MINSYWLPYSLPVPSTTCCIPLPLRLLCCRYTLVGLMIIGCHITKKLKIFSQGSHPLKKIYFAKKFHKGGGHLVFIPLFFLRLTNGPFYVKISVKYQYIFVAKTCSQRKFSRDSKYFEKIAKEKNASKVASILKFLFY